MANTFKQMPETWRYGQWFMADEWEPNNKMIAWIVVDKTAVEENGSNPEKIFEKLWEFHPIPNNPGIWVSFETSGEMSEGWGHDDVVMFMPIPRPHYPDMFDIERAMGVYGEIGKS